MNSFFKKILVVLPVFILTCLFLRGHYDQQYRHSTDKRLFALAITVLLLYAWIVIGVARRKQDSFFQVLLQSSFYVYIFSVLTLTGYFILFREVSAHDWWDKMIIRIANRKGVNLRPLHSIKQYGMLAYQVVGNFVMLMPLGIYIPLMYKRISGIIAVSFVCMLVSVGIELMQLVTNFRVTDIDDVILNTMGAGLGYIIYAMIKSATGREAMYSPANSGTLSS
jgi:glycopeptide antibiotics resistance protein